MQNFDKRFNSMFNLVIAFWVGTVMVGLISLLAVGFVTYKILAHFGIL